MTAGCSLSASALSVLPRTLQTYKLYDPSREVLTDAGRVLLSVSDEKNTFVWTGARRWIGLWLVWGVDGDFIAELLRSWPQRHVDERRFDAHAASTLMKLADMADGRGFGEDATRCRKQAVRLMGPRPDRRGVLDPHVEPLIDLGYIVRSSDSLGYALTDRGHRFRTELLENDGDADSFLECGLSRFFLRGEGRSRMRPARPDELLHALRHLPETLTAERNEAPVSSLTAWMQAEFVRNGEDVWVDDVLARSMATSRVAGERGHFELRRDEYVGSSNMLWRDDRR